MQRCELLIVELLVIVETEDRAQQFQVAFGDDDRTYVFKHDTHVRIGIQLLGVSVCLVIVEETADAHLCQSVGLHDVDVEIAYHKTGEIIQGHLI